MSQGDNKLIIDKREDHGDEVMTHEDKLYDFLSGALEYVENSSDNRETGKKYRAAACLGLLCVFKGLTQEAILKQIEESGRKVTRDHQAGTGHLENFLRQNLP